MLSRLAPLRVHVSCSRLSLSRSISTPISEPHAFLRPLLTSIPDATSTAEPELEGIMCLVLNRPETKNALSVRMVGEMREAIAKISSLSTPRILLIQSAHPGQFCSGADLRERRTMSPAAVSTFLDSLRSLLAEIEGLHIPTVAVIDGYALGGGAELALGCDLRAGGQNTKIALPETKLGIIPGAGGTQRLTHLVGVAKAKELIFTGKHVDGVEAHRMGLLNLYAQPPSTPLESTLILSRQILTSAPLALTAAKTAINAAPHLPLGKGLDLERGVYNGLLDTDDRQEGLAAFAEKRRARFTGQ
ncbi:hypothetical protein CI109_101664 [Kwoniella shandongensis]|uniref:Uncharacterized protein n=1 Tax=Kwoniella shandongensis TaxID=1734106 RepID=A0A5M6CBE7_9TREE|nr:uncharacterized protein CI109_001212 [Kwoniella shandongensis]KAA5530409.1 hypothetical protein CI109_001212 [Kwoniella shandongensis]